MAAREIIQIDEAECNGCGNCITGCAEGALQLVDGKAKLVKAQFCDGIGDCIGDCPTGALRIVVADAADYDPEVTRQHVAETRGEAGLKRFDAASSAHEHEGEAHSEPQAPRWSGIDRPMGGGCPGTRIQMASASAVSAPTPTDAAVGPRQMVRSDLEQWPVQLHLVQPGAPFLRNKELVVLSTCSPIASADVHWRFMRGRGVVVACPKLDRSEPYAERLAGILSDTTIPKCIVLRMGVPCCGGLSMIAQQAVETSGRDDLVVEEVTVGLNGDIMGTRRLV